MEFGDLYTLAIVATALFVAPFNAMARIIVLAWIVAHVGFLAGLPEPWANLGGHLAVAIMGRRHLNSYPGIFVWSLALFLVVVDLSLFGGVVQPVPAWWTVLGVSFLQLMILPMAIEVGTLTAVTRAWYESTGRGLFITGAAR